MTPVERAAAVYEREPCARTFREDLELHLLNGYVFSTPDVFMMGRAVCSAAPHEDIVNPAVVFPRDAQDCWLLYLAAGDIGQFYKFCPYPLKYVAWERENLLVVKSSHRVERLCAVFSRHQLLDSYVVYRATARHAP